MYVLVFPQLYGVHGIARYIQNFVAAIPDKSVPVVVLTADDQGKRLPVSNVEMVHLPMIAGRGGLVQWGIAARKWLVGNARRIRLINLHIPPLIPGLFLPLSAPILLTAHTTYLGMGGLFTKTQEFTPQWSPASVWSKMQMEKLIFSKSSAIVTLTEQGRQEILRYGFQKPIHVIPNGVDIERFLPDASREKDVDVLFAGRVERRKGSRPMVEIVKSLIAQRPNIRIRIVGTGDDFDYVQQSLGHLAPSVTLTGQVGFEGILNEYRRAKIYASASYYEGLPGTCLEAMAVGLPAVVWDCLFYRGLVGDEGALVPVNATDDFVRAVAAMLDRPEEMPKRAQAARAKVVENYTWAKIARDILKTYQETAVSAQKAL